MDKKAKRDALRTATLGQPCKPRTEVVDLNGHKIEVREVTYGAREEIQKRAQINVGKNDDGTPRVELSFSRLNILTVIETAFDPETGDKVFEAGDLDTMMALPESSFVGDLIEACRRVSEPTKGDKGRPTSSTETSTQSAS